MSGTSADLAVSQSATEFAVRVYRLTRQYPREETYGLTAQLRRAAVSVVSNIAEGKGRASDRELVQFLCHSRGSLFEVETQLEIGRTLGYGNDAEYLSLKNEAGKIVRMLNGLIRSVAPGEKGWGNPAKCKRYQCGSVKPEARSLRPAVQWPRIAFLYAITFLLCSSIVLAKRWWPWASATK